MYSQLADLILILHVAYVAFVAGGQILVLTGWIRHWEWVRNPWFRYLHVSAIGAVVLLIWLGLICPLTILENEFRIRAGMEGYEDYSFIGYWLSRCLFYEAPWWVFGAVYTLFGVFVLVTFYGYPPRRNGTSKVNM